jgi:exodeoxyribonuclease-1
VRDQRSAHDAAHDALSDVRATIALARLIKQKNPKLFDFCFALHKKDRVADEIGLQLAPPLRQPFLHISGMFAPERGCIALVWPLAMHPSNKNEVIVWDCNFDPNELFGLDAAAIRLRMFTRSDDLPEGVTRLPIKSIHINKSPMVVGKLKTLSAAQAERWGLDLDAARANAQAAATGPDMAAIWAEVFKRPDGQAAIDVDEDLYGGFIGNNDRKLLETLRKQNPQQLAAAAPTFDDPRLSQLLFRYRARNFPASLNVDEARRWEGERAARLFDGAFGARTIEQFTETIDQLYETADERGEEILGALVDYAESIAPQRI